MKSILLSIQPKWVAKILNKDKTIEVRKQFPKNYVGWVYIYCTKDNNNLLHKNCADIWWVEDKDFQNKNKRLGIEQPPILNGKVVARFWCDKAENIYIRKHSYCCDEFYYCTNTLEEDEICKKSHLDNQQLQEYLGDSLGYAIHISKLEIFNKPKELWAFEKYCNNDMFSNFKKCKKCQYCKINMDGLHDCLNKLTKAPQNLMYIDIE